MIKLNYRTLQPIYEQIADAMRRQIIQGELKPGDKMPSVRNLAVELSINPNTIQHAYSQLESEGYVCCVAGKGNFVSEYTDAKIADKRETTLEDTFEKTVKEMKFIGKDKDELIFRINEIFGS